MLFWTRFGRVLGTVFGAFWTILGGFWGFQDESNFKSKLERVFKPKIAESSGSAARAGAGEREGVPSWGRVKIDSVY